MLSLKHEKSKLTETDAAIQAKWESVWEMEAILSDMLKQEIRNPGLSFIYHIW